MDLFVVDNIGDDGALEARDVPTIPKTKAWRKSSSATSTSKSVGHQAKDAADRETDVDPEDDEDDDDDGDYGDLPASCVSIDMSRFNILPASKVKDPVTVSVERFCRMMDIDAKQSKSTNEPSFSEDLSRSIVEKELKTSGVTKNIELQQTLPNPSEKSRAKLRKLEASKTKGKSWFNMPATELTEEVQRDLEVIQMRSVLDPKHFYKKNDLKALPKYFQVGQVLPNPLDHYNERHERRNKKKTIVDELMADAQFQRFNKRKYTETVEEKKRSGGYGKAHSKMKKLKKNK